MIEVIVQLIRAGRRIYEKKWSFFGVFVSLFLLLVVILSYLDLLPSRKVSMVVATPNTTIVKETSTFERIELPTTIEIPKLKLVAPISNATTTDVAILDKALLSGAVRYPTSARLGENGNIVIFAHSSYLPVVRNQAYKTFNGIQKLVKGDTVTVYADGTAYTYMVRTVNKESASSDAGIDLATSGRVLTLATCDSFGSKTDRFVVTADFVESHSVPLL